MRSIIIGLVLSVICFTAHSEVPQAGSMSFGKLIERFSMEKSQGLPTALSQLRIDNIQVYKNTIAFSYNNHRVQFKVISNSPVKIALNGKVFSKADFATRGALRTSILQKFNPQPRRYSWMNLFIPNLYAENIQPLFGNENAATAPARNTDLSPVLDFVQASNPTMQNMFSIIDVFFNTVSAWADKSSFINSFGSYGLPDDTFFPSSNFSIKSAN